MRVQRTRTLVGRSVGYAEEEPWQARAACRGPQAPLFFPPSQVERKDERERREGRAKAICGECAVAGECLDYALTIREPHGIWGAKTEAERKMMLARLS